MWWNGTDRRRFFVDSVWKMASDEKPLINFQRSFYVQQTSAFSKTFVYFEIDKRWILLFRKRQEKQKYLTRTDLEHKHTIRRLKRKWDETTEENIELKKKLDSQNAQNGTFKALFNRVFLFLLGCVQTPDEKWLNAWCMFQPLKLRVLDWGQGELLFSSVVIEKFWMVHEYPI